MGTGSTPAETIEALRERLRGPVLTPDDSGFAEATRIRNGMIEKTPALVARPTGTADVVVAVEFAREHGARRRRRDDRHVPNAGVVVDSEARTAVAQGGCLVVDLDREAQAHGLATPGGFVSETGLAGPTLGGGFGYLTRRSGWTADNLLGVEIVTADGRVRRASREENADLFWAVRGAGHDFGVVTSFTFRLHEGGPAVYGGLIGWPFDRAAEITEAYRALTVDAPRELTAFLSLRRAPPAPFVPEEWRGERICLVAVCHSGDAALAPPRALEDPVVDTLREQPYTTIQSHLDAAQPTGNHYYWKTEFAAELSDGLLAAMRDLGAENPVPGGQLMVAHVGGAQRTRRGDGAVGNRDARFVYGAAGMWEPDDGDGERYREWIRGAWERVRPYSTGGNYVNFRTADEGDERIRATYGDSYDRLVELKRRYDPENVFRANRNVRRNAAA